MDDVYKIEDNDNSRCKIDAENGITKEKIYEISQQIESLSHEIMSSSDESQIWYSCKQIFSLVHQIPMLQHIYQENHNIEIMPKKCTELSELFTEPCIESFFKTLQSISYERSVEPLYCIAFALYFNEKAASYCCVTEFFEHLSYLFEEAMSIPDENEQARIMIPIADIIMKCCNSNEDAEKILSSGVFDHIITFLTEIVNDDLICDEDSSTITYPEQNEKYLIKCVSTLLFYYELFEPATVEHLFDLAKQSIIHKHKESLKLSCEMIVRFYVCVPNAFNLIVLPDRRKNIFDYMLDVVESECEEDIPTGFDITPIFNALEIVLKKNPHTIMIYNQDQHDSDIENSQEVEDSAKKEQISEEGAKWKNHYIYAKRLSKKIDSDLIFNYVWHRKGLMVECECNEANAALFLLSTKIRLDEEVSTDIEISNINDLVDVCVQSGHYRLKEAFSSFIFSYIQYAPEFLLEELFSTNAIPDFVSLLEGADLECLPIVLDAFIRIVEVLGIEWNSSETYQNLVESIRSYVQDSEKIEPVLEWKFGIIESYFQHQEE